MDPVVEGESLIGRSFERVTRRGRWIIPLLVLLAVSLALEIHMYREFIERTILYLPPSAGPAEREAIRAYLDGDMIPQVLIVPLRQFMIFVLAAWLLAMICGIFSRVAAVRFSQYLALEVWAGYAFLLQSLVTSAVVGAGVQPELLPITIIDLAMIIRPESEAARLILQNINVFTVLYLVVLGEGLHRLCRFRRPAAVGIALFSGSLLLFANAGILLLLTEGFGFFG